tara:strand:- start:1298 stop:1669 length:372 start_codon:yes stop_codon:yes gene_type:complete
VVRFVGVDLPRDKKVAYALAYIHGIGINTGKEIVKLANISSEIRTNDLTTEQTIALRKVLEDSNLKLEGDLRRFNGLNIKRLNEINCHRGKRHRTSLPVRGQRTRTNARSRRGTKKTVTGRKK